MSRPANPVPTYRLHQQSGQARVRFRDPTTGRSRDLLLGKFNSPASLAECARLVAEAATAGRPVAAPATPAAGDITVAEMLVRFLAHADKHYRLPDGTPTRGAENYLPALRPLRELYAHTRAADFGPLALKAVRGKMVAAGLARSVVNDRVGQIRRVFKWAASEELVPVAVHTALATVAGLQRGRSEVRESESVRPVSEADVRATLPYLPPPVRAMVEVQLLSGMRPGEVCRLRPGDLDRSGPVWIYRPGTAGGGRGQHKTAHHGKDRAVCLGPQAQAVLGPYLTEAEAVGPEEYVFNPRRWLAAKRAEQRAKRRSSVQPSQQNRRKVAPKRAPAGRYKTNGYGYAVARAAERAALSDVAARRPELMEEVRAAAQWLRAARSAAEEAKGRPDREAAAVATRAAAGAYREAVESAIAASGAMAVWRPNRLRHSFATDVRKRFGLESAQVSLGHARADVSQIYAQRDLALAEKVGLFGVSCGQPGWRC